MRDDRGYAGINPLTDVARLKEVERRPRYLSQDEVQRLLRAAEGTYIYGLILTGLHTGMRKSELLNPQWADVDFENDIVTVQSNEAYSTKSRTFRVVDMTPDLRDVLRHEFTNRLDGQPHVFTYHGEKIGWA